MTNHLTPFKPAITRIKNSKFLYASGILLLANTIVTALGLIRTPAMTWLLPKDEVGMLGILASWMPFIQLLSLSGLDGASHHFVSKGQQWAFIVNITNRLRWSLLSMVALLAGGAYWSYRGDFQLAVIFIITGVTYPVTYGLTAVAGTLGGQERFSNLFWYRILDSLAKFTGFLPLLLSSWIVSQVVTFYGVNQIAIAVIHITYSLWLVLLIKSNLTYRTPKDEENKVVQYGKHLTVINGIGVLQTRTHAFLVATMSPLAVVADYSIGLIVAELFRRLWNIFYTIRYPPLVRLPLTRRRQRFIIEGTAVFLLFIILGILVSLLARWLIPIILPANYSTSIIFIYLLIAAVIIGVPGRVAETYYRTQQNERRLYMMQVIGAIVGVIIPVSLVLRWGAIGAAYGNIVTSIIISIVGIVLFSLDRPIFDAQENDPRN